ncbi:helix-turn-helix domain-containing protein [Bradyrhizobium sp. SRS-191]|uniref:helix-turn-helix domain-containing protein n=1 Tax=Bradyrhizobium sp. SRS-191 TaxID=2962606 RepID=UPI00211F32AA|nr:helix-turn-helix domain-containing protein [Bradyrhizobium sp. SRS-191]
MLNPFGKALRKLRIDRGWLLKDMAQGIGVATSFLSGVETGRKSIPAGLVEKIAGWAQLASDEANKLHQAAATSQREFKITVRPDFSDGDREAAALLARFGELPREKRDELHQLLKKKFL